MEAGFDYQYIDYQYVVTIIRRRALLFVAVFMAIAGIGTVVTYSLPSIYVSSATILVESQQIPSDFVRAIVTSQAEQRIQIIEQRMKARSTILSMIEKFSLYDNERGDLSTTELVDLARERIIIGRILLSGGRAGSQNTIAFTVAFEDESPTKAAQVANELVTMILEENVRARRSTATETKEFLEREADIRERELVELESEITHFKRENKASLPESFQFRLAALDRFQKRITDIDTELRMLKRERQFFKIGQAMGGGAMVTEITPRMRLVQQLNKFEFELIYKVALFSENHVAVRVLRQQIKNVEEQLALEDEKEDQIAKRSETVEETVIGGDEPDNPPATLASMRLADFDDRSRRLQEQRVTLEAQVKELQDSIEGTPQTQLALNSLNRHYALAQTQYQELTVKRARAELGEKLEEDQRAERFEVIEQPVVPQAPIRPNRLKFLAFSVTLAVAASGGLVFSLESIDTSIRSSSHLMSATNRRPIASIPYMPDGRRRKKITQGIIILCVIFVIMIAAGLVAIHKYFMPLDIFFFKLLAKMPV